MPGLSPADLTAQDIVASCDKIEEDEGRLQELGMTTPERRGGEGRTADMMSGEATLLRKREDGQVSPS